MSRTISLINMKGGVGKTTLAVNIAYALAKLKEKRVLLVDADPQFNATQYLLDDKTYLRHLKAGKYTIYNVFLDHPEPAVSTVRHERQRALPAPSLSNTVANIYDSVGRLDLIPSELRLLEAENIGRGKERKLASFLGKGAEAYDYILIDCPPTISVFTLAAFLASDGYLVPLKPDPLSTIGLPLLEKVMTEFKADNGRDVSQVGIVPTMVRETRLMAKTLGALRTQRGSSVFTNFTSYSTKVAEAVELHVPLFDYGGAERYGAEISRITDEFLAALG